MKKLISAASALAMAASMLGAVVPFTTGAADATKGFELKAFTNKAGETASTKISTEEINAGDVTIPIAVYVKEQTPDLKSAVAQWTVTSKDGDASNTNVTFSSCIPGNKYFDAAQDMTLADGSTASTDLLLGFCGTVTSGKKGYTFSDHCKETMYSVKENQLKWGAENSWGSVVWTNKSTYTWTGKTSDAFPIFVFEATFKKGTPAGTYTIDFLKNSDSTGVPATYFEGGNPTVKYTVDNKNIDLQSIDIVIGDSSAPVGTTTAQAPVGTTATAPVTTAKAPTTTANGSGNNIGGNFEINPNFIVKGKEYTVTPGEELEVVFEVESGDSYASAFLAELDTLPAGITATLGDPACYADPDMHEWELYNGKSYQIKVLSKDGAHPIKLLDKDTSSEYNDDIIQLMVKIPEDIAPGEYEYNFKVFNVTEFGNAQDGHEQSMFNATLVPGKLIVEGDAPGTTTAPVTTAKTPATTTQAAPATTDKAPATTAKAPTTTDKAPVTTATPVGTPNYGDTNCDNKVNIADVVVLNKWLNDAKSYNITPQGKLNADCCDEKGGEGLDKNDSDAIIRRIVHLVELPCTSADLK